MQEKDSATITHTKCPICKLATSMANYIVEPDGTGGIWYRCNCGVTFQGEYPSQVDLVVPEISDNRAIHGMRTYINLIEELTFGRKYIPSETEQVNTYMDSRGWVQMVNTSDNPDLIICEGILEKELKPLELFKDAFEILNNTGILYIDTPDTDYLARTNITYFHHWKNNENYILWNKRSLVRELERVGFDVIVVRRNATTHYGKPDTIQVIAQK